MLALLTLLATILSPNPPPPVSYACNGSTAIFTVNFPYDKYTDLVVTSTTSGGAVTTLVYTTDYTVSVTSSTTTASLTLNAPASSCPNTNVLKINRSTARTQPTNFAAQTTYNPALHTKVADRLEMQIQELSNLAAGTTINFGPGQLFADSPIIGDGSSGNHLRWNFGVANTWTATQTFSGGGVTDIAANRIDTQTATVLSIGATTATGITLGVSGFVPSLPGGLTVGAGKTIDTTVAGSLGIGKVNATSLVLGSVSVYAEAVGGLTAPFVDAPGGGALNIGPTFASSVVVTPPMTINNAVTVAAGANPITVSSTAATARVGLRSANTRVIPRTTNTSPPDCAAATLTLSVTQFLDIGIATCGTAQTINFPTWQGASGIVQGLPGTPAVGDIIGPIGLVATAASALTPGFGTGGTNGGGTATVAANTTRWFYCRLTSVTTNSETATCY